MFFCHLIFGSVVCSGELFTLMDAALVHSFERTKESLEHEDLLYQPLWARRVVSKTACPGPDPPGLFLGGFERGFPLGTQTVSCVGTAETPPAGQDRQTSSLLPSFHADGRCTQGCVP